MTMHYLIISKTYGRDDGVLMVLGAIHCFQFQF